MNRTFDQDQRRVYQEIDGKLRKDNLVPDANESKQFCSFIWDVPKEHNHNNEWLKELKGPPLTDRLFDRLFLLWKFALLIVAF